MNKENKQQGLLIKRLAILILASITYYLITYFSGDWNKGDETTIGPMIVSISSDGKYIISSNMNKNIILWSISDKNEKQISDNGNIYSAYFIKNTHNFMWQDLNNTIHVQNINGKELLTFKNFPVYGQAMTTDLKHFFASDINWTIFEGYGKEQRQIKRFCPFEIDTFYSAEKLLNLTLTNDDHYLLSSGMGEGNDNSKQPITTNMCSYEVAHIKFDTPGQNYSLFDTTTLWDVQTGKPLIRFSGLVNKSIATLSTDGKYVVGGDENINGYVWHTLTGKKAFDLDDLNFGRLLKKFNCTSPEPEINCFYYDKDKITQKPWYYEHANMDAILSLKFIDLKGDYLRFNIYRPFAILNNVSNRRPLKYFYLGDWPKPSVNDYTRDEAIDTAPAANILVVAKRFYSGIMVYKYDPEKKTLKKIWSPNLYPLPKEIWILLKNQFTAQIDE